MIVEIDILLWVVWGIGIFFTILVLIPLIRENRRLFNALSHNFIRLVAILSFLQGGNFVAEYLLINVLGFTEPIIPKNLQLVMIASFSMLAVILHFTLYAFGLKRHYGLPWIWFLFIIGFLIQVGTPIDVPVISSALIAGVLVVLFFGKAFKNRSGLMFGIALYLINNLIFAVYIQYVASGILSEEMCIILAYLIGNIILALASWDVYDKYLLYDRAREKAIKSTWIAKIIQTSNIQTSNNNAQTSKSGQQSTEHVSIQRHVKCPVCNASNTWNISAEVIEMREKSTKGIMLVSVPAGTTCDHEYGVYINHGFDILGYKD